MITTVSLVISITIYIVKYFSYMMRMFKMYFLIIFQIDSMVFTISEYISHHAVSYISSPINFMTQVYTF